MSNLVQLLKNSIRFLTCLLLFGHVNAQKDVLAAVKKIADAYNTREAISFTGSMRLYASDHPGKIIERMQSNYLIKGTRLLCSLGPMEMLLNEQYYVTVDKTIKVITIGHRKDLSSTAQLPVLNTGRFQQWITAKTITAAVAVHGKSRVLQLTDTKGATGYNLYRIWYDYSTGYIEKMLMETAGFNNIPHQKMVLQINYSKPLRPPASKNSFSENRYLTIAGNTIHVKEYYKTYQLINQL